MPHDPNRPAPSPLASVQAAEAKLTAGILDAARSLDRVATVGLDDALATLRKSAEGATARLRVGAEQFKAVLAGVAASVEGILAAALGDDVVDLFADAPAPTSAPVVDEPAIDWSAPLPVTADDAPQYDEPAVNLDVEPTAEGDELPESWDDVPTDGAVAYDEDFDDDRDPAFDDLPEPAPARRAYRGYDDGTIPTGEPEPAPTTRKTLSQMYAEQQAAKSGRPLVMASTNRATAAPAPAPKGGRKKGKGGKR